MLLDTFFLTMIDNTITFKPYNKAKKTDLNKSLWLVKLQHFVKYIT